MEKVKFIDIGLIEYESARSAQTDYQQKLITQKRSPDFKEHPHHYLLFCEHPHVYTLGKSGSIENLIWKDKELNENNVQFVKTNRGGDITYHGPGQLVAYPIFDLDSFFTDVHKYVRYLEEAVIRTLHAFGIHGIRFDGYTGVWIAPDASSKFYRKICAIGVHLSRWVSMHGLALNVNSDLSYFQGIVPCGIVENNTAVTSVANELGKNIDIDLVKVHLRTEFAHLFEFELIY